MKKRVILNERQLRNIIRESVICVLNEVRGYEDTMGAADKAFGGNNWWSKLNRFLRPKMARKYDMVKQKGDEMYKDAVLDFDRTYMASSPGVSSDPYEYKSEEYADRQNKNIIAINKYGRRKKKHKLIKPQKS